MWETGLEEQKGVVGFYRKIESRVGVVVIILNKWWSRFGFYKAFQLRGRSFELLDIMHRKPNEKLKGMVKIVKPGEHSYTKENMNRDN